ncbi:MULTISPECIES: hypothetical protein [unclassified Moorena]|nr:MULTISPECIES: hypothetical protein [unclassified Moorena]
MKMQGLEKTIALTHYIAHQPIKERSQTAQLAIAHIQLFPQIPP